MVEKDDKTSMKNKLKGRELYLLKHNTILGNKTKQNHLQELQEDLLEPQLKDNQLRSRTNRQRRSVPTLVCTYVQRFKRERKVERESPKIFLPQMF